MKTFIQQTFLQSIVPATQRIVKSPTFHKVVLGSIVASGILIGIETSDVLVTRWRDWLRVADHIVLAIFCAEIALKITSCGKHPWQFFRNGWNIFDFVVVAICLIPINAQYLVVLRLLRMLRVLRLVTTVPKLQLLVGALFKSIPSMSYVLLLLSVHFYIYAVLGTFLFGENDSWHFGSLMASLLTLFQTVTLEGWVDVMLIQMKGCASVGSESLRSACVNSIASPFAAPVYFISFIIFGTMIILNLFIGVVVNSMTEMQKEIDTVERKGIGSVGEIQTDIALIQKALDGVADRVAKLVI